MWQTASLVINPITVNCYALLLNCTTAVRASDLMTASSWSQVGWGVICLWLGSSWFNDWFSLTMAIMRTEVLCIFVFKVSLPWVKLVVCKSAVNPPVVYTTDRSKAVVPVLLLICEAFTSRLGHGSSWFNYWFSLTMAIIITEALCIFVFRVALGPRVK